MPTVMTSGGLSPTIDSSDKDQPTNQPTVMTSGGGGSYDPSAGTGDSGMPYEAPTWSDYYHNLASSTSRIISGFQQAKAGQLADSGNDHEAWDADQSAQQWRQTANDHSDAMSPSARDNLNASITSGKFWDHPVSSTMLKLTEATPGLVGATAATAAGAAVGQPLAGAFAGNALLGWAGAADAIGDKVYSTNPYDLARESPQFATMLASGMSIQDAQRKLVDDTLDTHVAAVSGLISGAAGTVAPTSLPFTGAILGKTGSIGRRLLVGGLGTGAIGASADLGTNLALNLAAGETGVGDLKSPDEMAQSAIGQFIGQGVVGGLIGGFHHPTEGSAPSTLERVVGKSGPDLARDTGIVTSAAARVPDEKVKGETDEGLVSSERGADLTQTGGEATITRHETQAKKPAAEPAPSTVAAGEVRDTGAPTPAHPVGDAEQLALNNSLNSTIDSSKTHEPSVDLQSGRVGLQPKGEIAQDQQGSAPADIAGGRLPIQREGLENAPAGSPAPAIAPQTAEARPAPTPVVAPTEAVKTPSPAAPVRAQGATYDQARDLVTADQKASASYLQRKLGLSYGDAQKAITQLEKDGVVSPANASGRRTVLAKPEAQKENVPSETGKSELPIVGEAGAQAARQAEVQRGIAEAQASEPQPKGGNRTKGEIAARKANNVAAERIVNKYPQTQQDWRAAEPEKSPGGIGARTIALERLQNMVNEANAEKVKIPREFNPMDNPAHQHSPAVLALREASDFLDRQRGPNKPTSDDWTNYMIREGQLRRGQMAEVMENRKREAEEALARQGKGPRAGEVSLDEAQASPEDIAKYRAQKSAKKYEADVIEEPERKPVRATDTDGKVFSPTVGRTLTPRQAIDESLDYSTFKGKGEAEAVKRLADVTVKMVGDVPVHYVSDADIRRMWGGRGAYGLADIPGDRAFVNNDVFKHDTPLHELFHLATSKAIDKSAELRSLINRAAQELLAKRPYFSDVLFNAKIENVLEEDPKEILTKFMTNDRIRFALREVKMSPELVKDVGLPASRKNSIWNGLMEIIRKALGMKESDVSAIELMSAITERAMGEQEPARMTAIAQKYVRPEADRIEGTHEDLERRGRIISENISNWRGKVNDAAINIPSKIAKAAMPVMDFAKLNMDFGHRFRSEGKDPMRTILNELGAISHSAEEYRKPVDNILKQMADVASRVGPEKMADLEMLERLSTFAGAHPDVALGEGRNAHLAIGPNQSEMMADYHKWAAREAHPELEQRYNALPAEVQKLYRDRRDMFETLHEKLVEAKARNLLSAFELPKGLTLDDMVRHLTEARMSEDELAHYEALGVKDMNGLTDFQKVQGPYFPSSRRGGFVVHGDYDTPTPKGSDLEHDGSKLDDNVRRFTDRKGAYDFVKQLVKAHLPVSSVRQRYFMEDAQGNRFYEVMHDDGLMHRVTSAEADKTGNTKLGSDYYVTAQTKHVEFAESMAEALEARKAMLKAGIREEKLSGVLDRRGQKALPEFTNAQTQSLLAAIERRANIPREQKDALKDFITETGVANQAGSRIAKSFIQRQKVAGAKYDGEGTAEYGRMVSSYIARAEHMSTIDSSIQQMQDVVDKSKPDDSFMNSLVHNEVTNRVYHLTPDTISPKLSPFQKGVMNVGFIHEMGDVMHLVSHASHIPMVALPTLAARYGVANAFKALWKAYRVVGLKPMLLGLKAGLGKDVDLYANMTKDMTLRQKQVMDALVMTGHLHRWAGVDSVPFSGRGEGRILKFFQEINGAADMINRMVSGLATHELEMQKNGGKFEAAMNQTRGMLESTQGHYVAGAQAPALQGKLRPFLQFRNWALNMLHTLGHHFVNVFTGETKEVKVEAFKTLAYMTAGAMAVTGTGGLTTEPLKILAMVGNALGLTPSPDEFETKWDSLVVNALGQKLGGAVLYGLPSLLLGKATPYLSDRIGFSNLLTYQAPKSNKPDDWKLWAANNIFGMPGTLATEGINFLQALGKGDYAGAIASNPLTPRMASDIAKGFKIGTVGQPTASGLPGMQPSWGEAFTQILGARSLGVEQYRRARSAAYTEQTNEQTGRSAAIKAMVDNPDNRFRELAKWNAAHPGNPIRGHDIASEIKARTQERAFGFRTTKKNKELQDRLRHVYGF